MNMLRLWNRLTKMPNDRLTKQIFNAEYHMQHDNWSSKVKEILTMVELKTVFENREICDLVSVEELFRQKAKKEWVEAVNNKPKLRTFQKFKSDFETSDFVKHHLSRYDRSILAKFRSGILQLRVETGRYTQLKLEDRTCQICNTVAIEDEFHFLCVCPKYNNLRDSLFQAAARKDIAFNDMSPHVKFVFLMSKCSNDVLKFLKKAWEHRKDALYKP